MINKDDTKFDLLTKWAKNKTILVTIAVVIAMAGLLAGFKTSIVTLFGTWWRFHPNSAVVKPSGPSLLMSNAFKSGHSLSKLYDAGASNQEFQLWKNRTEAHLEGLGIEPVILGKSMDDEEFSRDEFVLLRDQLRAKIEAQHGINAAATFVIGADIVNATQTFESYLTDADFRKALAKNNVSILEFGFSINSNINEAVFPKELKDG